MHQSNEQESKQAQLPLPLEQKVGTPENAAFVLLGPDGQPRLVPATPEAVAVYEFMQLMGHRMYLRYRQAELRFWLSITCNVAMLGWLWIR